jgi:sporulation protein YlmC with PRC-barrel domain
MSLSYESLRLSDIVGKPVFDAATGKKIGKAWDVRIRREDMKSHNPGQERWVASAIVITSRGALERFGFVQIRRLAPAGEWRSKRETIAWDRIEKIGPEAIEVRATQT